MNGRCRQAGRSGLRQNMYVVIAQGCLLDEMEQLGSEAINARA